MSACPDLADPYSLSVPSPQTPSQRESVLFIGLAVAAIATA